MKSFFIAMAMLLSLATHAQTTEKDTLKVVYADTAAKRQMVASFINGNFAGVFGDRLINPDMIDDVQVVKEAKVIGGVEYTAQILIKTKTSYNIKWVSLNDLKKRYSHLAGKPVIFMIDGNMIKANYDTYFVNEHDLLQVTMDKLENPKENLNLNLVKLLTKTEENIRKSKQIYIRGEEMALSR